MPQHILIVTSKHDHLNYEKVAKHLTDDGHSVTIFEPDSILEGSKQFAMNIDPNGEIVISYEGKPFDVSKIGAVWARRPSYYGEYKDRLRWLSMKDEYNNLYKSLTQIIPAKRWLNSLANMQAANLKLPQLARAAKAGFIIPQTVVSNSWQAIETLPTDKVIVKLAEMTVLYPQGKRKTLHTTVLNRDNLPKQVKPYPGIWQTFAPKQKEWRITVVGDKVFSAAIYTDESAKDDWRKHQDGPAVKFIAEDFPKSVSDLCVKFLQSYNLRYGAFDFIETPDNKMVYLEVNTAGQFAWIEDSLKLPISEAIAEELLRIAKNKN